MVPVILKRTKGNIVSNSFELETKRFKGKPVYIN